MATGDRGEATASHTFAVVVTPDGLRARLAALDVSAGHLQQMLGELERENYDRLASLVRRHVADDAVAQRLIEEIAYLAGG